MVPAVVVTTSTAVTTHFDVLEVLYTDVYSMFLDFQIKVCNLTV